MGNAPGESQCGQTLPAGDEFAKDQVKRTCRSLALSGIQGVWGHSAGALLVFTLNWNNPEQLSRMLVPSLLIVALALSRGFLRTRLEVWDSALWLKVYSTVLSLTSLLWGFVLAALLITEGQNGDSSIPVMLILTGYAAAGQAFLACNQKLHIIYQTGMWLPPLIASTLPSAHGPIPFLTAIFTLFLTYVLIQGAHYHREYLRAVQRESDLDAARRAAEVASQAKSVFVANISHEIRTPMNGLLGMLELSLLDEMPPAHRDSLESARTSALSLLGLLNELLDFSKIEAGRMQLESIPFDLPALVDGVQRLFEPQARSKGLRLTADVPPGLPKLQGDPTRLRQVLLNLVGNSIKFTERGSIAIDVRVRESDPFELDIAVTDTGIGIPAEKQPLIFEAFTQAESDTSRKYGGTGLGLAICHRLIFLMGGELTLNSQPGLGSRFSFTLKLQAASAAPNAQPRGEAHPSIPPLRVLLVEDNLVNQKVAAGLLTRHGHSVEVASNGAIAISACSHRQFDVVLMDVHMPEMGGLEATRIIRATERGALIPIIGLSASAADQDRRDCLEAGMDDYVAKPFQFDELARAFGRILQSRALASK